MSALTEPPSQSGRRASPFNYKPPTSLRKTLGGGGGPLWGHCGDSSDTPPSSPMFATHGDLVPKDGVAKVPARRRERRARMERERVAPGVHVIHG